MNFLKRFIPNIHKDGYVFVCIFVIISSVLGMAWAPLSWVCAVLTLWCVYFFRDPERIVPIGENLILSPADGVVQKIEQVQLPAELNIGKGERTRISIFLNVFNVHVNRVPSTGQITKLYYHHGKFFNASLDKASIHNERQLVAMKLATGQEIVFVQIAGLIARRIVCDLSEGQHVVAGDRFGIIRFGSRMDIYLPEGIKPNILEGQTTVGGETILAYLDQ
jgi:phosphatidylserine decarboxylase